MVDLDLNHSCRSDVLVKPIWGMQRLDGHVKEQEDSNLVEFQSTYDIRKFYYQLK